MDAARNFATIRVVARSRERGEAFIDEQQGHLRARLELAEARSAVHGADVVVAATNSSVPIFDGSDLGRGCHVTGIGSITPLMEEVDSTTIARCRIFVDSLDGVLAEAGELIQGEGRGVTSRRDWTEIGAVASGQAPGRRDDAELTYFKSVGHAVQDVAITRLCLDRAAELGIGRDIEL
jgi:ornithine cyclodeaminase